MEIDSQALTVCEVTEDGGAIVLGFTDAGGKPASVRLPLSQVGTLALVLPDLISRALRTRFGDHTLRYAYPLTSWTVEPSTDPSTGMITLGTEDGFSVCFSMPRELQGELAEALLTEPPPGTTPLAS
jgi:hypothetical protein